MAQLRLDLEAASCHPSRLPGLTLAELYVLKVRGHLPAYVFSQAEIAVLLGCSHSRVDQLERRALDQLANLPELRQAMADAAA